MKRFLPLLLLLCAAPAPAQEYFEKHLAFPAGASPEEKIRLAAHLVPTPRQLAWQQLETTAFLHFGINTFTDREWGDGKESPRLFNPTDFDADQWIRTLRDAGFRMVILTAKHHDGFCLWPTRTTRHSVASSPWRGGCGDVVREVRNACERHGMKFGVYLSPWDRNAACYGDSPAYNRFFVEQLTELLTDYGRVDEVWFDGACGEGPDGRKQEYDWAAFYDTIHRLQPEAVTAIMGDDVRWVGNERGVGRETEWSATVLTPGGYARATEQNGRLNIDGISRDLGSRTLVERADELFWYPSEVDVSIRPGWFHHTAENGRVKSLKQLADIYFRSVGRNSVLLLNVPPDRRGRIHEADSIRLRELAGYLAETFADDRVLRGDKPWRGAAGKQRTYALRPGSRINTLLLQEDIARGQRVERFEAEALTPAGWTTVASGTTIGYKRLLRFPEIEASKLRIRLTGTRLEANILRVAAYRARPLKDEAEQPLRNDLPREQWRLVAERPLTLDLGRRAALEAVTYAPYDAEARPDMAYRYTLSVSDDSLSWRSVVADGEFGNIMHNPLPQTVALERGTAGRYLRIEATAPDGGPARILPEELGVTLGDANPER